MKANLFFSPLLLSLAAPLLLTSCDGPGEPMTPPVEPQMGEGVVVVANIASNSISFINTEMDNKVQTITVEGSSPAYPVYVEQNDMVYVGDRALNKVYVIDPDTREIVKSISVGGNVFHMWADEYGKRLWVVGDAENVLSVIDLSTNEVVHTMQFTEKPHDVFVSDMYNRVYVSFITEDPESDMVVSYDAMTYREVASAKVGDDPHLFHAMAANDLFVATDSGITLLSGETMEQRAHRDVPGAHGIYLGRDGKYLYTSSISGRMIYSLTADENLTIVDSKTNENVTEQPTGIHNVVVNMKNNMLYGTNAGNASDKVTVYSLNGGKFSYETNVTVGNNPFGITFYYRMKGDMM